jgi:hypothetical protein
VIDLHFAVNSIRAEYHSAAPLLVCALCVTNRTPAIPVRNVMLHCQIRIDPTQRLYGDGEHERLVELFGLRERWDQTLHSFLWTHTDVLISPFEDNCTIEMPVPCSYDFNIAATTFFHGLEGGEVPLSLLFSGAMFYDDAEGWLQIEQLSWSKEAKFRLPVETWQAMMKHYYPNGIFLCIGRDVFSRLERFKHAAGHRTFDLALAALLASRRTARHEPRARFGHCRGGAV